MAAAAPRRVLIVDDEPGIQRIFKNALANYGFVTEVASDGKEALDHIARATFDVIVCDVHMPGIGGIDFLRLLREGHAGIPVILMTGKPSDDLERHAAEHGAFRCLIKPIMPSALREVIERAVAKGGAGSPLR